MRIVILAGALAATGCTSSSPDEPGGNRAAPAAAASAPVATPAASPTRIGRADTTAVAADSWLGRWTGVEGMYLQIGLGDAAGRYRLDMQWDLDNKGSFAGVASGDAIAFRRGGKALRLRASDGDATGLKYLAGKRDCLIVAPGEGYCRD